MKKIGVLTGGGDAPGLNAVIRAVVKTATRVYGWEVIGIEDGFNGLLGDTITRRLTGDDVRGLLPRGGSSLGCTNRGRLGIRMVDSQPVKDEEAYSEIMQNIHHLGLEALVVIGGEGTHGIAHEFANLGLPVVGVPKTIDNDLPGTDLTFGFDTALDLATDAIDRLHTTAETHNRVMVVEVMGREVGWIAIESGIAGGADVILIPEIPFYAQKIADRVLQRESTGSRFSIVVVAEGARPCGELQSFRESGTAETAARFGGIGERVGADIARLTGKETRVVVLGHLQRGGTPNAFDRLLASCYGVAAVHALAEGKVGHMVAMRGNELTLIPIGDVVPGIKMVPEDHYLVQTARALGISFAGELD